MKKTLLTALFVVFAIFASGQIYSPAYIITHESDTIYGEVEVKNDLKNLELCSFKEKGIINTYLPKDIAAFGIIDGSTFVSGVKDSSFVKVLILGTLSLYSFDDHYYIKKGNDDAQKIEEVQIITLKENVEYLSKSKKWKGVLSFLTGDCESGKIDPKKIKFIESHIYNAVLKYNKCNGEIYTDYRSQLPSFKLVYGLSISQNSFLKLKSDEQSGGSNRLNSDFGSHFLSIGLRFVLTSRRSIFQSLQGDIIYYAVEENSTRNQQLGSRFEYKNEIRYSTLSIPLVIDQSIPIKSLNAFFQTGISTDFNFNTDARATVQFVDANGNPISTHYDGPLMEINKVSFGIIFGGGLMYQFQKFDAGLRTRYIFTPYFAEDRMNTITSRRLSFSLIIQTK